MTKTMAEVFLFLRQGWNNIWKQNTIWLFGALPILVQLFPSSQSKPVQDLSDVFLPLVALIILLISALLSIIGVPYLAYCFSIGKPASVQETLSAVRKFSARVIGCSCLGFLIFSPCLFLILGISMDNTTQPPHISNKATLLFLPFSIFSALFDISFFGFFANDSGIRRNLKDAWALFTAHFGILAILGIILVIMSHLFSVAAGISTLFIQSGFDITSLSKLDYINPSMTLNRNILFILTNGLGQTIFSVFSASVFALAYLKYSGVKPQRQF
jgi:hypothetical protein